MARPKKDISTVENFSFENEKTEGKNLPENEHLEIKPPSGKVLIQNENLANQKTKILGSDIIEFDSLGVAEVEKEIAEKLLKFKSFKLKK